MANDSDPLADEQAAGTYRDLSPALQGSVEYGAGWAVGVLPGPRQRASSSGQPSVRNKHSLTLCELSELQASAVESLANAADEFASSQLTAAQRKHGWTVEETDRLATYFRSLARA